MSTAFQIRNNDEFFIGKNQDVIYDEVYLFTNQRGIGSRVNDSHRPEHIQAALLRREEPFS